MSSAREILDEIQTYPWFTAVGCVDSRSDCQTALEAYLASIGAPKAPARFAGGWNEAAEVAAGLDDESAFWEPGESRRRRALDAVKSAGQGQALEDLLNELSLFCYSGGVRPRLKDEELARVAAGAAQWTAAEAITWALVEKNLSAPNPFLPLLRIYEYGHWPLGMTNGAFVIF